MTLKLGQNVARQFVNADTLQALIADDANAFTKSTTTHGRWTVDTDIPIFTKDSAYINDLLYKVQE
jgi:hypothetical protein